MKRTSWSLLLLLILLHGMPGKLLSASLQEVWTARQAVAYVRQNSPDSQMAQQRIYEAKALLQKADVNFYPQLDLSAAYSQTDNPMYSFGNILNQGEFDQSIDFNDPGRTDNLKLAVGMRYRFYNGGQDLAHQDAAKAAVELSAAADKAIRLQLEFEAFREFQRIVETGKIVLAQQAALQSIADTLAVAQARYDAGDLLKIDLLDIKVQKLQVQEALIQAQHDHALAKQVLLTLMGLPGGELQISANAETPILPLSADATQRPELTRLTAAMSVAESQLTAARGSRLPTLDGFASYRYDKGTVMEGDGDSWLAGVKLNFKLFDGYQSVAETALSEARLGALRAEQKKLELALDLDVTRSRLALDQARQRLQVTREMVTQAAESARLSHARFRAGVNLVSDLIDSENRLTAARVRDALAASALKVAIADLRRSSGLSIYAENVNVTSTLENQP